MTFRELLKRKGHNQTSLAYCLRIKFKCYKSQQQVSSWCSGRVYPDILTAFYLSLIFEEPMEVVVKACLKSAGVLWKKNQR